MAVIPVGNDIYQKNVDNLLTNQTFIMNRIKEEIYFPKKNKKHSEKIFPKYLTFFIIDV